MSDLPPGWVETTVGEITMPVAKHRPEDVPDTVFKYIDIGSIDNRRNALTEPKCLLGRDAPSRARQLVVAGDTLLSTVRTYLRNTAIVPASLDGATASTGFCVLRAALGVIPGFLFHRVIESAFVNELSERQQGTSYPAVRDADVRSMKIAIPPTTEQHRIVEAIEEQFSRLDAGVASLQRAKRNLTRMRESVVIALMGNGSWPTQPLGDIAEVVGGVTKNQQRETAPGMVEVPYLRVANVQRGYLDLTEIKTIRVEPERAESLRLVPGDVLLNEGGDRDKLGRGLVWEGQVEHCIHQNHIYRARLCSEMSPKFVSTYANVFGRAWFERMGSQTTNLASISRTALRQFPVPTPPSGEQERIVAEIDRQFSILDAMEATVNAGLARSERLRQSILCEAFAGRLVPQDPADEPASALFERIQSERTMA